ncbi:MAG: hypothetical protein M3N97_06275 [Pseudomonadota bacterium]|nr:hypothetical protein [Pseudomonadota bacterium]
MKLTTWWLAAAACAVSTCALAQTPPEGEAEKNVQAIISTVSKPCATDIKTLCPGKDGVELMMCLFNNPKLTPSCKDAMAKLPPPG